MGTSVRTSVLPSEVKTRTAPLISDIEALVDGVPGWSPVDELFALATLALTSVDVPGDIVEIGAWCGRSTVVLASVAAELGGVQVHAVDLFPDRRDWRQNTDGSFSFTVEVDGQAVDGYTQQTVWGEAFAASLAPLYATCENTFEIFRSVVAERGFSRRVHPYRGTSQMFARSVGADFRCRLAFVDGDHGYDAVRRDIQALLPLLSPGGWLCFDDAHSGYAGVDQAIADEVTGNPAFTLCRQLTRKLFVARKA